MKRAKKAKATAVCKKCKRRITDPESIERGFGPQCWASVNGGGTPKQPAVIRVAPKRWRIVRSRLNRKSQGRTYHLRPGLSSDQMAVSLPDGTQYDVRPLAYHTEGCVDFGRRGDGALDCARSILADCLGLAAADLHYERFAEEIIAKANRLGEDLNEDEIRAWAMRADADRHPCENSNRKEMMA